ncbi:bifunctional diguanylate cyclase/phosphodiesterase [Vibrio gazogenes]|uniref:Diguanylate cyclase (GGDEF) domain-containing protein n=1 Tax=Vibrio gazogenes DSM 21264 = NBRC 103151 TaxID=1123492 RepID=A0A1M4T8D5_VIBGA|nr:bifunctional diguanylate cyclase/phosphodiesterase [Vibrio gazogenes]USP16040.1 bifunctional diguanylate cyclase/phosphodiesterase [Vibrio gazogenes]SHE40773.1 diguanylate cyclase (GGDEF) domain-containing protein [Vibrio gazogenes DSM 21264] [Vibrio gazogenes DSM 21264 = NBRC 103151]
MNIRGPLSFSEVDLQSISELISIIDCSLYQKSTDMLHQATDSNAALLFEIDKVKQQRRLLAASSTERFDEDIGAHLDTLITYQLEHQPHQYYLIPDQVHQRYPHATYLVNHQIEGYLGTLVNHTASGDRIYLFISLTQSPITEPAMLIQWHRLVSQVVMQYRRYQHQTNRTDVLLNRLNYEVSHDDLTNLMNRSFLADTLERLVSASQSQFSFSLGMLDINDFKYINDLYGNYIGDQVLRFVAHAISACVQDEQLTFRIAGDEFAFITFDPQPDMVCQEILTRIRAGYQDVAHHIRISASIGIARHKEESNNADQLLLNASLALKNSKKLCQPDICCYDTHLSEEYHRKNQVIDALRDALSKDLDEPQELYAVLQPIVRQHQLNWNYFEVLCRWQSPVLGDVSPTEFIAAAEQSGLIIEFGYRVIELACLAKQQIEQSLGQKIRLSINCSAYELNQQHDYIQTLKERITHYGFYPGEFTIEITETALLSQRQVTRNILSNLRDAGFKVALDDFGTGYSSLNYIHNYPIDCIKIDASFIKNMLCNDTSEKVVSLIIQLANQLGVDLVAEGVEEEQSLARLYEMGCTQIQGYLFSAPLQPEMVIHQLLGQKESN